MWKEKHINEVNKGRICKAEGCNSIARAKGLCMGCYHKNRRKKKMTYKDSGVDIEKEEKAIKNILLSIRSQRKKIGKPRRKIREGTPHFYFYSQLRGDHPTRYPQTRRTCRIWD